MSWRRVTRLPDASAPGDVVLSARGVHVRFGQVEVLAGIDLDVRAGEVVALVGPNGAGKSTLLGALSGDIDALPGTVTVNGTSVADWTSLELALRRGVLPQRSDVSFPFTVEQVVRMGREPWRNTEAEDADDVIVAWATESTDVVALMGREFPSLSGGEQARAALARVLAQQPGLLLLDEPTASLDIAHQEQVLGIARTRAEAGDAVVVVLHDLGLAAAHADRVVVVSGGVVVADGPPADVMTDALLSAVYGCAIEVLRHPRTGALMVLPRRDIVDLAESLEQRPLTTKGAP
ncbi:MAG TPA: heme ABC transporter ATP-binding protein [Microthrixaceae bacterium]|nr:heme ABC transporter ATP-binding protein [Microthrixaceae bacterium]HNI35230.1 heme ABC transporter ATP-binding protein [Microthrixaceae bacterium]